MLGWNTWTKAQKGLTLAFGTIAAICTGLLAVPPAWTMMGLPKLATHSHIQEIITPITMAQKALDQQQIGIRLDIGTGRANQIKQEQRRLQSEMERTGDANYKQNIKDSLDDLDEEAKELTSKLRLLREKQ